VPEPLADLGWGWVTLVGGVVLIAFMLKYLLLVFRDRRTWVVTEATVGKVNTRQASATGTGGGTFVNYHYTDAHGQQHMGVDSPWFGKPKRKSKLRIRYDPDEPARSEVVTPLAGELAIFVVVTAWGVAMILMSLAGWLSG
jgi:hypothetical protein